LQDRVGFFYTFAFHMSMNFLFVGHSHYGYAFFDVQR